jgi:hypothetical protein
VITDLDPAKTYHFSVFEFNGVDAPVYNKSNVMVGQATTPGALPLTWTYFTAKQKQDEVELKWGTTDEVNTAYFVVERSVGGAFVVVDSITAKNVSGDHDYTFVDGSAPARLIQYRVKQVDIDGRFTYSRVVVIDLSNTQSTLRLFPNPAPESFRLVLPAGVNQARVSIYDVSGKQVWSRMANSGELIEVNSLLKGVYNVVVLDGAKRYVEKLVKL